MGLGVSTQPQTIKKASSPAEVPPWTEKSSDVLAALPPIVFQGLPLRYLDGAHGPPRRTPETPGGGDGKEGDGMWVVWRSDGSEFLKKRGFILNFTTFVIFYGRFIFHHITLFGDEDNSDVKREERLFCSLAISVNNSTINKELTIHVNTIHELGHLPRGPDKIMDWGHLPHGPDKTMNLGKLTACTGQNHGLGALTAWTDKTWTGELTA
ncbi:hypothetical protein JTE90_019155 [Oedothorax gibbosus]|uniref:Uncharacterized protein n=1 Tax=Oedothorax gibbosus TaxID=931172 RepID=A0AAV6UTZ8_9ARAC|nr:hypothetical protein JTE90_019155 [Oedothorax gibbosus]